MATKFKEGTHLFFLLQDGYSVQDSKFKPRYYLNKDRARTYGGDLCKIVEYAPLKHGYWIADKFDLSTDVVIRWRCSECKGLSYEYDTYCGNCGAKMDDI